MSSEYVLKRTTSNDPDFLHLVQCLDHELWVELEEDQATYEGFNKVPNLETCVVLYVDNNAVSCGCFKITNEETVEIKRMFVQKGARGKGFSKKILAELETWAIEKGYKYAILETSVHFETAKRLYESFGYESIPNYPPYIGLEESVCMRKGLL